MRNYDELPSYHVITPIVGLFLGAMSPFTVVNYDRHLIQMLNGTYELLIISLMTLVAALFTRIGERHPRLGHWASDTLTGTATTLFAYGLAVSGLPLWFVLLPIPAPVLFIFAVIALVAAGYVFFHTTESEQN